MFMGAAESIEEQTGVVRFGDNENVWQDQETTSGGQEHLFDDLNTEAKGNASFVFNDLKRNTQLQIRLIPVILPIARIISPYGILSNF